MYSWLVSKYYCTEENYPRRIEYDALSILSGRDKLPTEPAIFRGSIGEARDIQRVQPGNIVLFMGYAKDSFDAVSYSLAVPKTELLNRFYLLVSLGDLKYGDYFGVIRFPMFIRPNSGFKTFSGHVCQKFADLEKIKCDDSTICLITAATNIIVAEYRYVVVNRQVITGSRYLPEEGPDDPNVFAYAQKVVQELRFEPDSAYILDVSVNKYGWFKVIEWNSFSCSGLYQCDIPNVCEAIENSLNQENDLDR